MVHAAVALTLATSLLSAATVQADTKPVVPAAIMGLDPALSHHYEPSLGNFTCLDQSRTIPFSAINDDYCDCPDGSDEPGTSACEDTGVRFYCANEGHIPGRVLASRVNDGICDPECCDGSDEWQTGACPNQCEEIGREYRTRVEAETKTRKTGAKIRGTYVKWAQAEKKRLEDELKKKTEEVKDKEVQVEQARIQLENSEARSHEQLEKRKQSPLYTSLLSHRHALSRLRTRTNRLQAELDTLHSILEELSKGYNPNYQDMAVKAAVVGYEDYMKPISAKSESDSEAPASDEAVTPASGDELEEEISEEALDDLEKKDLEALLLSDLGDDEGGSNADEGVLYRIEEYIPDSLYDSYESIRDLAIDWLIRLGVIGKGGKVTKPSSSEGPHVAAARDRHQTLSNELTQLQNTIRSDTETLRKMGSEYGPDAEWKKLDGTCVEKESGDPAQLVKKLNFRYTYELCFFGRATQKNNRDHSSNYLGTFSGWKAEAEPGSFDYYTRQMYTGGGRCWNGPLRSATVDLSCGTTNALVSIMEPEKCEYRFKVTTPALCWPLDKDTEGQSVSSPASAVKEEL